MKPVELKPLEALEVPKRAPVLAKQVMSVAARKAMAFAADHFGTASAGKVAARLAVCNTCPHRMLDKAGTGFCAKCGCPCEKKVKFASEKCPINKW